MSSNLPPRNTHTVYLGGGSGPGGGGGNVAIDNMTTTGTPLPGMLAETYNDGGIPKWRAHSTAAGPFAQKAFYIERGEYNQDIDTAYEADELARVMVMYPGSLVYALVPSGQNIVPGDYLESNGDGYLKEGATAPVGKSLSSTGGAVTVATRVRVEVL